MSNSKSFCFGGSTKWRVSNACHRFICIEVTVIAASVEEYVKELL
jgi:hypothetical protein